jgi:7-keto-8-aminopelargonate synthetase-like enzyme
MKTQTIIYFSDNKDIFVHRGTEEYHNIIGQVDIINSTLGKAMGGASGGYTAGPKELIDLLRQRGRPYLFSNSLPPPVVATGSKVSSAVNHFNVSQDSIIFTISLCTVRICL